MEAPWGFRTVAAWLPLRPASAVRYDTRGTEQGTEVRDNLGPIDPSFVPSGLGIAPLLGSRRRTFRGCSAASLLLGSRLRLGRQEATSRLEVCPALWHERRPMR